MRIDWDNIDTVLLDMDGTLIDKFREDQFWATEVPRAYAKKNGLKISDARKIIYPKYREKEGQKDFSNIDYWENTFGLDLWPLRRKVVSSMNLHPHTLKFLDFLKKNKKSVFLVTAASPKDAKMKLEMKKLKKYLDAIYTQNELDEHKYTVGFWKKVQEITGYDKNRTMLADDDVRVASAAKTFGIRWIVFKTKYNSRKPPQRSNGFLCVRHFDELIKFKKKQIKE